MKTVMRTLEIFETFAKEERPLTVSEVARLMDIPLSSAHGLLQALKKTGYLYEISPRSGFYPSRRIVNVGEIIARSDQLINRIRTPLLEVRDRTNETVVLSKIEDNRVLYLCVVNSRMSVRYAVQAGQFRNLHTNSAGKAMLGQLESAQRLKLLKTCRFERLTPRTLTSIKEVEADLELAKKRGYYLNDCESTLDLAGVAVALMYSGEVYSLSIAGPANRIMPVHKKLGETLMTAAHSIQQALSRDLL